MTVASVTVRVDNRTYELRVFSSLYLDWGLEINEVRFGEKAEKYYCPSSLSRESYGFHWEDEDGHELEEGIEWTEEEWAERLKSEAWELIDAYIGEE